MSLEILRWVRDWGGTFLFAYDPRIRMAYCFSDRGVTHRGVHCGNTFYVAHWSGPEPLTGERYNLLPWLQAVEGPGAREAFDAVTQG